MQLSMKGRTALITGASSGLGAHFARLLSGAGANVVLAARRIDRTEALARELDCPDAGALGVAMDVTDEASVIAAYDAAEARFGTVDTIIANAGVTIAGPSVKSPLEVLRTVTDTNFLGVYLTVREGARRLIAAGAEVSPRGRIVLIGSITSHMTDCGDSAYAATKAAVAHLGRNFAREWARKGINVNTIQPGYVMTELNQTALESERGKEFIAAFPRRRVVSMEALDPMMLYFASDVSAQTTGAVIDVDDGQSL
jgi:NAD(P)-dependent dehydrogenase (short-subunit alcohol dehydrogenase family)